MFNPKRLFRRQPRRKKKAAAATSNDANLSLKELALRSLVNSVNDYVRDVSTDYADVREMADGLAWWPPEALEKVTHLTFSRGVIFQNLPGKFSVPPTTPPPIRSYSGAIIDWFGHVGRVASLKPTTIPTIATTTALRLRKFVLSNHPPAQLHLLLGHTALRAMVTDEALAPLPHYPTHTSYPSRRHSAPW